MNPVDEDMEFLDQIRIKDEKQSLDHMTEFSSFIKHCFDGLKEKTFGHQLVNSEEL